ncbi:MAG: UvrD-helicase domain-containing protein, partial [Planctomycetota bacterium]
MAAGDKKPATPRDAATRAEIIASTRKSMLVEAAAGTGKTTLIVDRILQGVCDGTLRLANAVAITFTERAAGELESRLRARLAAELYRYDPASVERSRIQAAIEELDRANLSTIHAFCARILREKAAEAGVDPEFAVLEATAADVLRERCWREWMDAQVAAGADPLVDALRAGVSVADLKEIAVALTNAPEVLEAPRFGLPAPAQSREHSVAALRDLAPEAADILREHMTGRGNEHSRKLRRLASSMAAAGPDDVGTLRRLAYAVAGVPVENALTSISRDVRDEAARVFSDLRTAAMGLGAHLSEAVFHWLAGFLEHYRQAKLSRSVLDFQDLLLLTARVLRDNLAVRRYFQRRFDAFFVDEFQDTDPLQAELIAYLCEDGTGPAAGAMELVRLADGKLFAVGDPKQSIYRFRRADVQVYDRFKGLLGVEAFGEDRTRQIFCNFRSVTPLLGFSNAVFGRLFEQPAETGIYQARHVPLEPPVTPDLPSPAGACVMAVCPPPDVSTLEWNLPVARRCEARVLARIISAAVAGDLSALEDGFSYGDFAMLFRVLTDVSIYEEALDDCGIPYRVIGGKHFYRREQVVETLALLQAVEDPLNEAAVVGALRSSFFGFSDEELFRYREGGGQWNYLLPGSKPGAVGQAMQTLAAWHRRRTSVPPHVLLHQVFDHTKVLQTFLLKPAGRQRVANLEKLSNQLRSLWKATGTFGAVVRHLSAIHEAELPEEESSVVEPGDDLVRIMSMHKAKGLQFRAVVLPDLAREFTGVRGVGHLLFNRLDGRVGLRVAAGIESENYQELAGEELGNQLAEQRRLLYVACTRAQRLLILPLHWSLKGRGGSMQQLLAESG